MLIDVIWAANYSIASSPGAITTPALTRYTDGKGLRLGIAVSSVLSAVACNPTITYNAPEGNGHTCLITIPASAAVHRWFPNDVAAGVFGTAGDTGVTAITNISLAATGTGNIDVFIFKPMLIIPTIVALTFIERDSTIQIDGLSLLPKGSDDKFPCLGWIALSAGTSACAYENGLIRMCSG
jgi:hypothetical protein